MRTEDLIQTLAEDLRPVAPLSLSRGILVGLVVGAALALFVLVFGLGSEMDFDRAAHGWSLWIKWLYTAPICAAGFFAANALSRPADGFPASSWIALLSVVLLVGMAASELSRSQASAWPSLCLGQSWRACSWRILLLSVPIFAALTWKVRQAAPIRLRLAGAAIGLASGAAAAAVYALGCSETAACFILVWYPVGIAGAAAIGALLGPTLLRW
jgi:hypothetical protein